MKMDQHHRQNTNHCHRRVLWPLYFISQIKARNTLLSKYLPLPMQIRSLTILRGYLTKWKLPKTIQRQKNEIL